MDYRDYLRKSCWRWLDPKKGKEIHNKKISFKLEALKGDWDLGDHGEGSGHNDKEHFSPYLEEKKKAVHTTMMTNFCSFVCNSSTNSGRPSKFTGS
jgi:hypothetical protein